MKKETREQITHILQHCVDRAIHRVKSDSTHRPFHEALLTKKLLSSAVFERSFSTSFGQGPIEEISQILAIANGGESVRQKETLVNINKGAIDEIERIISSLRSGENTPNWTKEVSKIQAFKKGDYVVRRIISDLWVQKDGHETFISIKTVKPNIDQTEIVKKDMLLLKAENAKFNTFFGLYYNPGGDSRADYNWSIPSKIFDMKRDPCVLIGEEYWELVGGSGAYQDLLEIFESVGKNTRKQLEEIGH
ncbi:MAG: MjaII restriction endonuclease [uncultured Thiotrichaceae bacterium]|uniref:type II site-specific deoxyribonuclease n=1 Tax=uncultured Thiotrichaceae bacterium TaxID=298394 RepID=A0A6S6SK41_9GAMM|nr:MAG: MjaII restriction endonuclease [uncultured Thiotrichaceae bacterium]